MKIYLSGTGWVAEAPTGNRLRWGYPTAAAVDPHTCLGLPRRLFVERAEIQEDIVSPHPLPTPEGMVAVPAHSAVPNSWWDDLGTFPLRDIEFVVIWKLPGSVQAIRFTYRGTPTHLRAYVQDRREPWIEQEIQNGQRVTLEGFALESVAFPEVYGCTLEDVQVLDLFRDRGLPWQTVARIDAHRTLTADLPAVLPRYSAHSDVTEEGWQRFRALLNEAQASAPGVRPEGKDEPKMTPWEAVDLILATRWEMAVLAGLGFQDGPHPALPEIDRIPANRLLDGIPLHAMAYRVRSEGTLEATSNLIVIPPLPAPPLAVPAAPLIGEPVVQLAEGDLFQASLTYRWQALDARASGAQIEQVVLAQGAPPETARFDARGQQGHAPPFPRTLQRSFAVSRYDARVGARVRNADGFDRVGGWSPWSPLAELALRHFPPAPPLRFARYQDGIVTLTRQGATAEVPAWQPDRIVREAGGRAVFFRRDPARPALFVAGQVGEPGQVAERTYTADFAPGDGAAINPNDFVGGYLIAGQCKAAIHQMHGLTVTFHTPDSGTGSTKLFAAGPAWLQQDPRHPSLWQPVHDLPAIDLPEEIAFADPLPEPAGQALVVSYLARISYLGNRLGPPSNSVQVLRVPATPVLPPPFTVELLGVDFFGRSMVRVTLTKPCPTGAFAIWWAAGQLDSDEAFRQLSVPGEYGTQAAQDGIYLYDVLSLPVPLKGTRAVTIGLQSADAAGGQSRCELRSLVVGPVG